MDRCAVLASACTLSFTSRPLRHLNKCGTCVRTSGGRWTRKQSASNPLQSLPGGHAARGQKPASANWTKRACCSTWSPFQPVRTSELCYSHRDGSCLVPPMDSWISASRFCCDVLDDADDQSATGQLFPCTRLQGRGSSMPSSPVRMLRHMQ